MKPTFVISSPFDTYSGYGARSRDVIKSIIATDKYDVKLLSQRWGATPFGFCENHPEFKNLLESLKVKPEDLEYLINKHPDFIKEELTYLKKLKEQ